MEAPRELHGASLQPHSLAKLCGPTHQQALDPPAPTTLSCPPPHLLKGCRMLDISFTITRESVQLLTSGGPRACPREQTRP